MWAIIGVGRWGESDPGRRWEIVSSERCHNGERACLRGGEKMTSLTRP